MDANSQLVDAVLTEESPFDFESTFRTHYARIARIITKLVRDPARGEDLATEAFVKLWRHPKAHCENAPRWLYRVAVRKGLDELRRQKRREHYEGLLRQTRVEPTPEEIRTTAEVQERVRSILAVIAPRQAELLVLRSHGFSYEELALSLGLNPASIGTLLGRAQQAFRKEYEKRYGQKL
jgi:RNA polymerase sigma-70 factor (ECF subfamily)